MRPTRAALVLVALAFALRAAYAAYGIAHPESGWLEVDPDRYVEHGWTLVRDGVWRWTIDSVMFSDGAHGFVKSPLYQVFLSVFARFTPDYPTYVPIGHAALGALTTAAVFLLAAALHSTRAGVIGAAIHATWLISIVSVRGFWQEQLYMPLFALATAWCVRSLGTHGSRRSEATAGILLALAALTRSMSLWLAPFLLLFRRWRIVAAFALVVVPYAVYLSLALGRLVVLENVGPAYVFLSDPPSVTSPKEPQPFRNAPLIVARQMAADPVYYVRAVVFNARMTLTIAPHRWLEFHAMFATEAQSRAARAAMWLATMVEIVVLLSAPVGVLVARNRKGALLVAIWIALALLLAAMAAHQGPRFRVPVDALFIALAACALAGGWSSPRGLRCGRLGAVLAAGAIAGSIALTLPHALRIRGDYGLAPWDLTGEVRVTRMQGTEAGFGVHPLDGSVTLVLRCAGASAVTVHVQGGEPQTVSAAQCDSGPVRLRFEMTHYTYIKVRAPGATTVELELFDEPLTSELMAQSRGTHLAFPTVEWLSPDGCDRCVSRQARHCVAGRRCSSPSSWCSPSGSSSAPAGPRCSAIS